MISSKRHILLAIFAIALLLISPVHCNDDTTEKIKNDTPPQFQCERLPTSLTYKQDAAPADVSAILRVVVEKINRDVTGVVDVEVNIPYMKVCTSYVHNIIDTSHLITKILL